MFREQEDGRKVSRLASGKVVLVSLDHLDTIQEGERWRVRVLHRESFAIAEPLERVDDEEGADEVRNVDVSIVDAAGDGGHGVPSHEEDERGPGDLIRAGDRVAIFVDGANTDQASREAGYLIDYGKMRSYFAGRGTLYGAFYYAPDFRNEEDSKQQGFLDYLNHSGYVIRLKRVKRIVDHETGEHRLKANLDADIIVDMLATSPNYDVAVLFSGDSDYERAVDVLRSKGKRLYVVSDVNTLGRELAYVADKPVFLLSRLRSQLERRERSIPNSV